MTTFHKSGIPIQSGLIQRDDLLKQLSRILDYPLTILSAPAGCGKTALATQVVDAVSADVIWNTVSQYEQDLSVFLQLLLKSLDRVAPGITSLLSPHTQPLDATVLEMSSYLRDTLTRDLLIVIDDWHLLPAPDADEWLQYLVDKLPPNCHLLILSQSIPALNMIELFANRKLLRVAHQDLFFTRAEVYMLASQVRQIPLSADDIESIWLKLQGWPVGTMLALQPAHDLFDTAPQTEGDTPSTSEILFQSIASQMLAQELPDIQHFLKWTSTGEMFNQEFCDDVFNIIDSDELLAEVIQRNLFISQRAGGYQYHRLFRNFLQTNFKLTEPEEYRSAHRRLAGWFQSHNQPVQAIQHYFSAGSYEEAIQITERIVYAYYAQGRIDTILNISDQLAKYIKQTPHLNHVRAQIHLGQERDLDKALDYAQHALDYFQAEDLLDQYDAMVTIGLIQQTRGKLDESLQMFETILEHDNLSDAIKGTALNQLGVTKFYAGKLQEALDHLTDALTYIQRTSSVFHLAKLYQELELVHRDMGHVDEANRCLQQQIHYWRQLNHPEQLAMALNNLGYRQYEQGQYQLAEQTYAQGLETIANMQSARARYYMLTSIGDLRRDRGQYAEARISYQRALNLIAKREPYAYIDVLINLSTLYRWQGRYEAALTCAEDAMAEAQSRKLGGLYTRARIAQWQIRLQPWTIRTIQAEIDDLEADQPRLLTHPSVDYLTLKLRLAILQSSMTQIHSILQRINHLHNREESVQAFMAELANNDELLTFWSTIKRQYPALNISFNTRAQRDDSPSSILPIVSDTHSLHFYTLGVERIRKNHKVVNVTDMQAERFREVLYYFVFIGATKRETLEDMLWGDKPAEARRDNFHQTLSRIRGTLGSEIIVYDSHTDLYRLNPDVQIWCDALQLESLVTEARHLSYLNQYVFQLWYQATQLTHGQFLADLDRDWITGKRQYFHKLNIEAWTGLATYHRHHQDYRSAIAAYEHITEFAPLHEAAYRGRMECYAALGEMAAVTTTYQLLEQRLDEDMHLRPSEQSISLYHRLTDDVS